MGEYRPNDAGSGGIYIVDEPTKVVEQLYVVYKWRSLRSRVMNAGGGGLRTLAWSTTKSEGRNLAKMASPVIYGFLYQVFRSHLLTCLVSYADFHNGLGGGGGLAPCPNGLMADLSPRVMKIPQTHLHGGRLSFSSHHGSYLSSSVALHLFGLSSGRPDVVAHS